MRKYTPAIKFHTTLAFTAAAAVHDSAGSYDNVTSKSALLQMLTAETPPEFTPEQNVAGERVLQYYRGLVFKVVAGQRMSPLNQKLMELASGESVSQFDLGAIAFAPQGYSVAKRKMDFQDRVDYATGGLVGTPGSKFSGVVEVLRCVYSSNYGVYFVTAATEGDSIVYFAVKQAIDSDTKITIRGTVKAHRDTQTQLNRVKIDGVV